MKEKNFKNSFKQRVLVTENNITLPSAPAILKVFVMVICFMITKLGHLRELIYQGVTNW